MHQTRKRWIESVAAMQGAAVVPDDQITLPPLLRPHVRTALDMSPQFVEQRVTVFILEADDPRVGAATEIERGPTSFRVPHDQWVNGTRPLGIGIALLKALAELAGRIARRVVFARQPLEDRKSVV